MFYEYPVEAAQHFLSHGETTVLAALYYNLAKDEFLTSIDRVKNAMKTPEGANIAGFYMEGPYMNPKYGGNADLNQWKGDILESDFKELVDRSKGLVKVWAVAPEREGIEDFMKYVRSQDPDTTFSVGHSEATPSEIKALKKYGITIMTHCMNATGRIPHAPGTRTCGPDEYCFMDDTMYAELICDSTGVHVSADVMNMVLKIKGIDKIILIADSFVSEYENPEEFKHIDDISFDHNGNIAGSKLTMDKACRNFLQKTNCGIAQSFLAASTNPAKAIGLYDEIGSISEGKKANLVFVDDRFNVKKVMLEGNFIDL